MDLKLRNRTIVVIGAGGIGSEVVRQLVSEGADVVAVDTNQSALDALSTAGLSILPMCCDCGDPGAMERVAAEARQWRDGPVYGMAFCSGVVERCRFDAPNLVDLMRTQFAFHVVAPVVAARALLPQMVEAGEGALVFISSVVGSCAGQNLFGYGASKHAANAIAPAIALEYGSRGIHAVTIAPGRVGTESARGRAASDAALAREMSSTQLDGQWIDPAHVAAAMMFCLSPLARSLTGTVLDLSAGNRSTYGAVAHLASK